MTHLRSRRLLLLALLFLLPAAYATPPIVTVPATAERLPLGRDMTYLLDPGGTLDAPAALASPGWRPVDAPSLNFGFRKDVLWVRLALHNAAPDDLERWLRLEPEHLEQVSLFTPGLHGTWERRDGGVRHPGPDQAISGRIIAFPVHLAAGSSETLLLRVQTRLPLAVRPVLWTRTALDHAVQRGNQLLLLGIGSLLGLGLYAVLLYPLQRDTSALWLGLTAVLAALTHLSLMGFGQVLLWPGAEWATRARQLFVAATVCALLLFLRDFLAQPAAVGRRTAAWSRRLLLLLAVAALGVVAGSLAELPMTALRRVIAPVLVVTMLAGVALSARAAWRGWAPGRLALLALVVALVSVFARLAEAFGLAPLAATAGQLVPVVATALMALLFFAAISRRVDLLRRETDAAKAAALAAQTRAAERLETQVAERTRDLHRAKDQAERADRAKGELLARVSHELRTPLQAILGYAYLLQRDAPELPGGGAPERLALLTQSGQHLSGLIDDLLEYARGERGGITLDPRAAYLHHLVHRLAQQGALLAARHRNRWRCRVGHRLPAVVRMDARRVEQAVLVLLSNAARYTRGGGILLAVSAEPAGAGQMRLCCTVSDTGPGIAAADLERIFEPFERALRVGADGTAADDAAPGLGLGLPIARQIARAMAGDVTVQSLPDRGSRFRLRVTLAVADEAEVPALLPDLRVHGYAGPRRRLLVVEDHPANRCWLEQLFAELGFTVHAVGSVAEAHEVLAQQAVDLALLDQRLPDGTGWDILRHLRDAAPGQAIPAVLLSALPATPPADWGTAPGFDAALLKPVDASELLQVMARLLALEWISAPPPQCAAADGPRGSATARDDTPSTPQADPATVLSEAERDAIADLARAGAVYELEDWILRLRDRGTGWQHLTRQLDERLAALDFEAIAALAAGAAGKAS